MTNIEALLLISRKIFGNFLLQSAEAKRLSYINSLNSRIILHRRNKTKGMTLIETVIYILILTSFLIIITQSFISILDVGKESQSASGVESDARYIISRLSYDISNTDDIVSPVNLGSQSSSLTILTGTNVITYSFSNGNLIIDDDKGTDQLNSIDTQASDISFQRLGESGGKNIIKTRFTLTSTINQTGGAETKYYETISGTR
jgi:type II secretory pathway pseudopilin PulG